MTIVRVRFQPGLKPIIEKHAMHDQQSHGNWAAGKFSDELKNWNPEDKVPSSPRNAGGVTGRALFAWEHGPDGQNFIDLFRKYAAQELGLPVPQTPFDQGGYLNYMMQRGWGAPNRNEVKGLIKAIENGKPQPTLYRGLASKEGENSAEFAALKNVKEGDTFDMPLVSTTRSLGVASWYASETAANKPERILVRIKNGAKGYAVPNPMYEQDSEVIVSGKFRVNSVEKVSSPYWARTSFEVRRSNPIPNVEDRNPGQVDDRFYEVVTYTPRLRDLAGTDQKTAKKYYDAVASGNYKSIQTADFKLTNDRPNSGIRSDVPAPLSAWFRESAKDFTLIDIEMIEPHSVAKVDGKDYGNMFHNLFNGSSSIDDSGRNFQKHQSGTHDQESHGNWATGNYSKIGGAGVDITKKLDEIFADPETTLDLQNRLQAQVDAGQKGSDVALDLIIKLQGFDGKPKTTKKLRELNDLEESGEYIGVYRGLSDFSSEASRSGKGDENSKISQTATQSMNDFVRGEYFTGQGIAGSGVYTTTTRRTAESYAFGVDESDGIFGNGKVMKILIPKNIKMASPELVTKVTKDVADFWQNKFNEGITESVAPNHQNNVGRKLASLGYQAYRAQQYFKSIVPEESATYIILDRSAIVVSEQPSGDFERNKIL